MNLRRTALLAYAVIVISLAWDPCNVLSLALLLWRPRIPPVLAITRRHSDSPLGT
jgi:hypothetical protein